MAPGNPQNEGRWYQYHFYIYIFWIHHEPEEGKWNWSGNHNLRRFVRICAEENVMLVLRLGPFCHGEVYQGGIPSWVHEKAGQNPKYKIRARTPGIP